MLTAAAVFLLLLMALLAIPITLRFRISWRESFKQDIRLQWAFGLVHLRIDRPRSKGTPRRQRKPRRKAQPREHARGRGRNLLGALGQRRFRRRILRFARDLWRAVHKRDVRLRVRIGLDDPADTGQLWAVLGPLAGMLATLREPSVIVEPAFAPPTFALDTSGSVRIIPLEAIYLAVGLLSSPSFWRGIGALRRARPVK